MPQEARRPEGPTGTNQEARKPEGPTGTKTTPRIKSGQDEDRGECGARRKITRLIRKHLTLE
jgi:hypothetical protein